MKYYVVERLYDQKGKLIIESRITGDTEDLSWAKKQMDHRFNTKLFAERNNIQPGAIATSATSCSLELKNDRRYVVCVEEKTDKIYKTSEILIGLNNHFNGDWAKVYSAISKRDPCEIEESWLKLSKSPTISLLDLGYPNSLKQVYEPPFVLYYKGDTKLLSSKSYVKLAVTARRETHENLLFRVQSDIRALPQNVIIVTSDKRIAEYALAGSKPHKVILVKACGMNKEVPMIDVWAEMKVIQNGGLVITHLPDDVPAAPTDFCAKDKIISGIADGLLVVDASPQGSGMMLVTLCLASGKDVMAYPTFPQYNNSINNTLISEGAYLVEKAEDIKNILEL